MKITLLPIALFWSLFALFMTGVMLLVHPITHQPVDILGEFIWNTSFSLAWIIGTPAALRLSAAFPVLGANRFRNGLVLFSAGLLLSLMLCVLHGFSVALLNGKIAAVSANTILNSLFYNIDGMLIVFVALAIMQYAMEVHRTAQQQQVTAARLETQLSQARMTALRMQLQPHFLFNTMNSIVTLIRKDPDQAEEMIVRLSDFLRITLEASDAALVPLQEELRFIRAYLSIEEVRFGGRVRYTEEIHDAALQIPVPALLLQPLVENAVRHGISRFTEATLLKVTARSIGGCWSITVEDDAAPAEALKGLTEGIGLTNTRQRLSASFGPQATLVIAPRPQRGCIVTISIPREGR
ncbi:MAG: histidine kinase [Bacteroidetes bacterium]|nr:histidine kinase [Bacteroidota bacterium]